MKSAAGSHEWRLLSRPDCHLCHEMAAVLEQGLGPRGEAWLEVDVDGDAALRERYGEVLPVLLRDGRPVAKARLDRATLERLKSGRWSAAPG